MKKLFFLFLVVSLQLVIQAQTAQSFADSLPVMPLFKGASVSVCFREAATGKTIVSFQDKLRLAPASNMKVVSTAAALLHSGPERRYKTDVFLNGKQEGRKFTGDIIIKATGDPTMGSQFIAGVPGIDSICYILLSALKERNISSVTGSVKVMDSGTLDLPPDYYPAIDMGNYYGATPGDFCINDNLYYLVFIPGKNTGDPAAIKTTIPAGIEIKFENEMKTGPVGSGDNGYIYRGFGSTVAKCTGTIPAGVDTFAIKGSIPYPSRFFEKYLTDYFRKNKISFSPGKKMKKEAEVSLLYSFISPPLLDIVTVVNKRSNNLFAEQLLLGLLPDTLSRRETDAAIDVLGEILNSSGVETKKVKIKDGSGLSRNNQVTTSFMTDVLIMMSKHALFREYYSSFPVAGDPNDKGGFKSFGLGTGLEKNARIKSGLIDGVRGLTGYLTAKSGKLIVFSCISNNHQAGTGEIDGAFRQLMLRIFAEN